MFTVITVIMVDSEEGCHSSRSAAPIMAVPATAEGKDGVPGSHALTDFAKERLLSWVRQSTFKTSVRQHCV